MTGRTRAVLAAILAGGVALAVALLTGGGDDSEPATPIAPVAAPSPQIDGGGPGRDGEGRGVEGDPAPQADPDPDPKPDEVKEGPSGPAPETASERAAAATARAYVRALDARDGAAVCGLFAPGALDMLEFPRERGSCAATVEASLGYADPRGLPVWERSELTSDLSAQVSASGDEARVVATVFTLYADVREPSIEDDIVYLVARGGEWRIAKPSATIHRAVGIADVPPSVIAPPG